ncbi:NrdH-redoxin [Candidatus Parvarchaeota archaeon]|jgi:glutaredoxin-like YruB-family protein|nr:MAG: NrdH-redoxin [Candidatus Parvarchaeota archaeon]HIG52222.1 glutaredoxin family protein [Candidatus Pacearchaeota archaeon]
MSVIVYSTPTCPWCKRVKEFLKKEKVSFKEVDVSEDEKAVDEMVKKSGQKGVPVTDINGKIIVGYQEEELKKALKK